MYYLRVFGVVALQLIRPTHGDIGGVDIRLGSRFADQSNTIPRSSVGLKNVEISSHVGHNAREVAADASPCTGGFESPRYQVFDFQFNKTTTGDLSMTHFQLNDVVNNGSTSCTTPYLQESDEPVWNDCDNDDDAVSPRTIFKYTESANELEINQMWICEIENKTHPHPYFSSAKVDLSELVNCVDDTTQTRCTVEDTAPQFGGDYTTPAWNSDTVNIIPPSQQAATGTPWNPSPCIGPSFSYPNWDVQDFSHEGEDGSIVSFRLNNHASNQSVTCTVEVGELSSCKDNSTTVRFSEEMRELLVNQTWICNGDEKYSKDVTFRAVGSGRIDTVPESSTLIKGSLTEPIQLTPNVAPEGVNHPGCIETSDTPSWIVTSWVWNEKWRNGYNTGDLTVTFYNPSTGFNLTCKGDGEELNRDGRYGHDRWWGCSLETSPFDDYRIISLIKLDPLTEVFSIDQRWSCNSHGDKLPAKFKAVGDAATTLDCSWNNDTSTNTTIKTCYQTELPLTVEGGVTDRTELPADVFFELAPGGYSCTIASVLATQWRTTWSTDALYAAPTFPDTFKTKGYYGITFVALDGSQYVNYKGVSLTPFLPTSEPGRWYDCKDYETGEESSSIWARNSLECKWQLDLATGYFAINHTWYCDDKNPDHPIIFKGSGSRFYDFSCYVDRKERDISCNPTGLNPPPVLPTYLSWETVPIDGLKA